MSPIKKERNSSIELLRILLMVMIIMHHVVSSVIAPGFSSHGWACLDVVLHTAVIVFVLISGYFGIRFSWKRFVSLILQVVFYSVLLSLVTAYINKGLHYKDLILAFMPFSNNYYWFVTAYLQLYLVAFFLNKTNRSLSDKEFFSLIGVLAFFVFYLGFLRKNGICSDGKNLVNFIFIYEIGQALRRYQLWLEGKMKWVYAGVTSMLVVIGICYFIPDKNNLFVHAMAFLYKYNSPFLILLSVLIFLCFLNIHLHSKWINYLAASSFSIYLIHEHPLFREFAYVVPFKRIKEMGMDGFVLLGIVIVFAISLSLICMLVDKIRVLLFSYIIK